MSSNQIQLFQHEEFGSVRAIEIEGEPWFVGKDVAVALGYANVTRDVNRHVDAEDRGGTEMVTPGGMQKVTIINESGLYSLILSSKLPSAKKFRRWVTSEILPSVRKFGAYINSDTLDDLLQNPDFASKLFQTLDEERRKSADLKSHVEQLAPKARYYDLILQSKTLIQTSIIARDYGMSAVAFNRLLHDLRIQYRMGGTCGTWLLYQEYSNQGYTKTRTYRASENTSVIHTYWTQKGRLFLYNRLKAEGILPCMEAGDPTEGGDCP